MLKDPNAKTDPPHYLGGADYHAMFPERGPLGRASQHLTNYESLAALLADSERKAAAREAALTSGMRDIEKANAAHAASWAEQNKMLRRKLKKIKKVLKS